MRILGINVLPNEILNSALLPINNFISILSLSFIDAIKIICRDTPTGRLYNENVFENLRKIIWGCLPIATLVVGASAIIYAIHVAVEFSHRGLTIYFGGLVALALIREGAPVMGSLAIVTQFCSGMTAQIGSMKVSDQIDAMKLSKVNPNAYLLVPMLISGIIGFPIIVLICILTGLIINFVSTNLLIDITVSLYTNSIENAVRMKDIFLALVKASAFGFPVNLISYVCGITTVGGSKAVGSSTRLSVVLNFAVVVILDYIITALWL